VLSATIIVDARDVGKDRLVSSDPYIRSIHNNTTKEYIVSQRAAWAASQQLDSRRCRTQHRRQKNAARAGVAETHDDSAFSGSDPIECHSATATLLGLSSVCLRP
jgi:hypothetical protein